MINKGNPFPIGIFLLKVRAQDITKLLNRLEIGVNKDIKLDEVLQEEIKPSIMDGIVYSKKTTYKTCTIIEDLIPKFVRIASEKKEYILGDYDADRAGEQ